MSACQQTKTEADHFGRHVREQCTVDVGAVRPLVGTAAKQVCVVLSVAREVHVLAVLLVLPRTHTRDTHT
jgi:hypothetical protein